MADNIKVVIKVRPLIKREIDENLQEQWTVSENTIYPLEQNKKDDCSSFTFDHIFDCKSQTQDVYDTVSRPIVESAVDGINGTIFAYGQTSSGKTFTMMGDAASPGIIPLAITNIFEKIESQVDRDFLLRVSYIEIYNEKVRDLLDVNNTDLKIHEDFNGQTIVKCKEEVTSKPHQVLDVMKKGDKNRSTGETQMNEMSSRSHTIFIIIIESRRHLSPSSEQDDSVNVSQLNLVDLAGSERAAQTGATKQRLREGGHINKSLTTLGLVIRQLSEAQGDTNRFISFRDSKLTLILRNSLGGNAKTGIICAVTPAAFDETNSTLMFAMRAKAIQNKPKVNAVVSDATLIKRLTKEMATLQEELESKKLIEVDNKRLQEQLFILRDQILMGNNSDDLQQKRATSLRRRTWCAPRRDGALPPILEDTDFMWQKLKTNKMVQRISTISEKDDDSILGRRESTISIPDSSPKNDDIICLDDSNECTPPSVKCKTPPSCGMSHKCFDVGQTPPCILRLRVKNAEKEKNDLVEMTTLEQMYAPDTVELIELTKNMRAQQEAVHIQLNEYQEIYLQSKKENEELKVTLDLTNTEKAQLEENYRNLECVNTDLEFQLANLKARSQNREQELLNSLNEARVEKERPSIQRTSLIPQFLNMSQDISLAGSDIESIHDVESDAVLKLQNSISQKDIELNEKNKIISSIEENLKDSMLEIEFLKLELQKKIDTIIMLEVQTSQNIIDINKLTKDNEELMKKTDHLHDVDTSPNQKEIQNYFEEVSKLESLISDMKNQIEDYCQQIKDKDSKINTLENRITITDIRENELSNKISELELLLKKKEESHKLNIECMEKDTANFSEKVSHFENLIISLQDQISDLKIHIDQKNSEISVLENEIKTPRDVEGKADLKHKLSELEELLSKKDEDQKIESLALSEKIIEFENNLKIKNADNDMMIVEISRLKELLSTAEIDKTSLHAELDLKNKTMHELNDTISKLKLNEDHLHLQITDNSELENKIFYLEKSLNDEKNNNITLSEKILQMEGNVDALINDSEKIKTNVLLKEKEILDLQDQLRILNITFGDSQNEISSKTNETEMLKNMVQLVETELKLLQKEVNDKDIRLQEMEKELNVTIASYIKIISEKDHEIKMYETQIKNLILITVETTSELNKKNRNKINEQNEVYQNLHQENDKINACLKGANERSSQNLSVLQEQLLSKANAMTNVVTHLEMELSNAKEGFEDHVKENFDKNDTITKMDTEITQLSINLHNSTREFEELKIDYEEVESYVKNPVINTSVAEYSIEKSKLEETISTLLGDISNLVIFINECPDVQSMLSMVNDVDCEFITSTIRSDKNVVFDLFNKVILIIKNFTKLKSSYDQELSQISAENSALQSQLLASCNNELEIQQLKLIIDQQNIKKSDDNSTEETNEKLNISNRILTKSNKENIHTPLKSRMDILSTECNTIPKSPYLIGSVQLLKSPKLKSSPLKSKLDTKTVLEVISQELSQTDASPNVANLTDVPELIEILHQIRELKTSLKNSNETNKCLQEKVNIFERICEEMSLLLVQFEDTTTEQGLFEDSFKDNIVKNIGSMKIKINQFIRLDTEVEKSFWSDAEVEKTEDAEVHETIDKVKYFYEDFENVLDCFESDIFNACVKFGICNVRFDNNSDLESKFNSLMFNNKHLIIELENLISHRMCIINNLLEENNYLKGEREKFAVEMKELLIECEELQKKIISNRSAHQVAYAEFSLCNSRLSAAQHYHTNLHSSCSTTISYLRNQLTVLQSFLQNYDYSENINDISFDLLTPTPRKKPSGTPSIKICTEYTVAEMSTEELTPKISDEDMHSQQNDKSQCINNCDCSQIDNIKTECVRLSKELDKKSNENVAFLEKLEDYESLKKRYTQLQNEYDSLSMELMDSLQEVDDFKVKYNSILTKFETYKCDKCIKETLHVSMQTSIMDISQSEVKECKCDEIAECLEILKHTKYMAEVSIVESDPLSQLIKTFITNIRQEEEKLVKQHDYESNIAKEQVSSLQIQLDNNQIQHDDYESLKKTCIHLNNEIAQLKSEVEKLHLQNDSKASEIQAKCTELEDIHRDNCIKSNDIERLSKEVSNLRDLHTKTVSFDEQLNLKNDEIIALQNILKTKNDDFISLNTKYELLSESVDKKKSDSEIMVEDLNRKVNELELKISNYLKEKYILQDKIEESNNLLRESENKICTLKVEMETKNDLINALQNDIKLLNEKEKSIKNSLDEAIQKYIALQETFDSQTAEVKQYQEQNLLIVDVQKQLSENHKEKIEMSQQIKILENNNQTLQQRIQHLEDVLRQTKENEKQATESNETLKLREMELSHALEDVRKTHQLLKDDMERKEKFTNEQLTIQREKIQVHEKSQLYYEQKISDYETEFKVKDIRIKDLDQKYKEEKENWEMKVNTLNDEMARLSVERKFIEEEKFSLLSNNDQLSRLLEEKDLEINETLKELSLLKSYNKSSTSLLYEKDRLQSEIFKQKELIMNLEFKIKHLEDALHQEKSEHSQKLHDMETSFARVTNTNIVLENRVTELQSEMNTILKLNPKIRNLHLKRQSIHDLNRSLIQSAGENLDVSMEDCTNSVNKSQLQILEEKYKHLEEKFNNVEKLHTQNLEMLKKKTEDYANVMSAYKKLEAHLEDIKKSYSSKQDAATNTVVANPEDNGALMSLFVDKLTHNFLKEKYNKLEKVNRDLQNRNKEQGVELRRLQHSLQNNTLHNLLPKDGMKDPKEMEEKMKKLEAEIKELNEKMKYQEDWEMKYKEMDKEYEHCADLLKDVTKSNNTIYAEKKLLEVELKNLKEEMDILRKGSPGKEIRKKRQSMHDMNRGTSIITSDAATDPMPSEVFVTIVHSCKNCESTRLSLQELKSRCTEMESLLSVRTPIQCNRLGSGIVQDQKLSEYMVENQKLKIQLSKYKEHYIRQKNQLKHLQDKNN